MPGDASSYQPVKSRAMRLKIFLTAILLLLSVTGIEAAGSPSEELKAKGIKDDVLRYLNRSCRIALNFDLRQDHAFWKSMWDDKKGGMIVVDFLQGKKHYVLVFLSMDDGSCQTSRTITTHWTDKCEAITSQYKERFPKGGIKVDKARDTLTRISNKKGTTDVYLYETPSGCIEIFKEFYVKSAPERK